MLDSVKKPDKETVYGNLSYIIAERRSLQDILFSTGLMTRFSAVSHQLGQERIR